MVITLNYNSCNKVLNNSAHIYVSMQPLTQRSELVAANINILNEIKAYFIVFQSIYIFIVYFQPNQKGFYFIPNSIK